LKSNYDQSEIKQPLCVILALSKGTYQIPNVVGKPVNDGIYTADKLQMLSFGRSLANKKHDETGGYEGHGDNNKDSNHKICALTPRREEKGKLG